MKPHKYQMGNKNMIGNKILNFRKRNKITQNDFLARLQSFGLDISSTSLSRLEWQQRTVKDMEILVLAKVMHTDPNTLLDWNE